LAVATTSRLTGSGPRHREITHIRHVHTRSIHDRYVWTVQRALHTERPYLSRVLVSSGPSAATLVTLAPHYALVLQHLDSQRRSASQLRESWSTRWSHEGFAPAAVHGTTMVFAAAPQSFHPVLALQHTAQTTLR